MRRQTKVILPVAEHRCPTTGTKLHCLVTEAHVCEQLSQGRYLTAKQPGVELATSRVASQRHTITPPCTNVHVLTQELPILNCHMDIVIQIDIYKEINLLTPITCNSIV